MVKILLLVLLPCIVTVAQQNSDKSSGSIKGILPEILHLSNGKVYYSETVDCGSVTQLEVFRRARLAILQLSADEKILLTDKETGDLVSVGSAAVVLPRNENSAGGVYSIRYTVTIECLNRKYRAAISSVEILEGTDRSKRTKIESFILKPESDLKAFYTAVDFELKGKLENLKQLVKNYEGF